MPTGDDAAGWLMVMRGGECAAQVLERHGESAPRTAVLLVVTNAHLMSKLASAWPSWDEFFLAEHTWPLLQIDPSRLTPEQVASSLRLHPGGSSCELPPRLHSHGHTCWRTERHHPVLLRASPLEIPPALGETLDEAAAFRSPRFCHAKHTGEYLVGTKWYVWALYRLAALDHFDFFLKVDLDVVFRRPLRPAPAHAMALTGATFAHTQRLPLTDAESACGLTLDDATAAYLRAAECGDAATEAATGASFPRFFYYSNVMGGWLGLFRSPQLMAYAQHWWSWPGGWWSRWGDQQFWPHALHVVANVSEREVLKLDHWRRRGDFVHLGG